MAHRLTNINGSRFIGDAEQGVVHDRRHEECEDCLVQDLVDRGRAVGFRPDTLAQAFDEGYDYCDWCLDGSDPDPLPEERDRRPRANLMLGMAG